MNKWIKDDLYLYTMKYHSATVKKDIVPFATTWMVNEGIVLSERSKRKINTI